MKTTIGLALIVLCAAAASAQVPVQTAADQQALLRSAVPALAANKQLVFDFWREVLQTRDTALASKYLAESYIQHNPSVPSGRQGFVDFFSKLERQPLKPTIDNLVSIVADGDLVVLALRRELKDSKGTAYTTTWFDMFRIANKQIVEHWDYGTRN